MLYYMTFFVSLLDKQSSDSYNIKKKDKNPKHNNNKKPPFLLSLSPNALHVDKWSWSLY